MNLIYTNIQHIPRKKWKLSLSEYVLCDMIYQLSNNPKYNWCIASKEYLANELGLSKQGLFNQINKMLELEFLEKDSNTKFLKTTQLWYNEFIVFEKLTDSPKSGLQQSKKLTPTVQKIDSNSPKSGHYNNIDNNIDNNSNNISKDISEKNKFPHSLIIKEILNLKDKIKCEFNPELFIDDLSKDQLKDELNNFYNFWTEERVLKNGNKKQKRQEEKYFEINKRFRTWVNNNKKWNKSSLSFKSGNIGQQKAI